MSQFGADTSWIKRGTHGCVSLGCGSPPPPPRRRHHHHKIPLVDKPTVSYIVTTSITINNIDKDLRSKWGQNARRHLLIAPHKTYQACTFLLISISHQPSGEDFALQLAGIMTPLIATESLRSCNDDLGGGLQK
ncbi:hypothetical protein FRX31_014729 [Thalictrum thalictroides]|uniref:Uncharacterized protein n=1 Tax=Thalictrum thalictroides TaxID=46969 RepID=A0A7J6WE01_THATH|nr:hypothetical protein FRX31_014729 [Thalictrum thalictroides]